MLALKPLAAFIRAIGPETHRIMPQADLCKACERLGLEQAKSFIASGNLYFKSDRPTAECSLIVSRAIAGFGLERPVFTRTADDLDRIIGDNPWPHAPISGPTALSVSLFDQNLDPDKVRTLLMYEGPESIKVFPQLIYVHYTEGQARSKISHPAIERRLKLLGTARNLNTIVRMRALLTEMQ
jgi:uncharacterized protein (DUF1697 family)